MTSAAEPPAAHSLERRRRGRPRSEATKAAIFEAALTLLREVPYPDISIDRIAHAAKVGKQSIYRWWPSKADLLLEAYLDGALASVPQQVPSDDPLADFEAMLVRLCEVLADAGVQKSFRSFLAEAQFDAEFRRKFFVQFVAPGQAFLGAALERGIACGRIRPDLRLEDVMDMVLGAIWFRILSGTGRPLDQAFAESIGVLVRAALARRPEDQLRPARRDTGMFEA